MSPKRTKRNPVIPYSMIVKVPIYCEISEINQSLLPEFVISLGTEFSDELRKKFKACQISEKKFLTKGQKPFDFSIITRDEALNFLRTGKTGKPFRT